MKCTSYEAPHYAVFSILPPLPGPNILLSTLFSDTLNMCPSLGVRDEVSHPYKTTGKITVLYILIKFLGRERDCLKVWWGERAWKNLKTIYREERALPRIRKIQKTSKTSECHLLAVKRTHGRAQG
jgi:hypothetical protein